MKNVWDKLLTELEGLPRMNNPRPFKHLPVPKKTRSKVYLCKCGKRFIKTQGNEQKTCLFCIREIKYGKT